MTVSGSDLAAIRSEAAQYLVQRATIRRKLTMKDGRGGQIEDWYDLAVNVPYRRDDPAGGEGPRGEKTSATQTARAKFAYDQDLRTTDQVIDEATGEVFSVTYVQKKPFDAYRQADLETGA
jgi:hypothetical protein